MIELCEGQKCWCADKAEVYEVKITAICGDFTAFEPLISREDSVITGDCFFNTEDEALRAVQRNLRAEISALEEKLHKTNYRIREIADAEYNSEHQRLLNSDHKPCTYEDCCGGWVSDPYGLSPDQRCSECDGHAVVEVVSEN